MTQVHIPKQFFYNQRVKIPMGDGTYQFCFYIGTDCHGLVTVKTLGGRYKQVWECNIYPA